MELKAISQRRQAPLPFSAELAERAAQLPGITVWTRGAPELEGWPVTSSLVTTPIMPGETENLGALLLVRTGRAFHPEEVDLLKTAKNMINSIVLQGHTHLELQRRLKELETIYQIDHDSVERRPRQVMGRSVAPRMMERLLAGPEASFLKGKRMTVSVLYAGIRGSARLARRIEPELLVGFINSYLEQMTEVILAYEGILDKYVGDEVMALFGVPFPQRDHALRAVRAAIEMQAAYQKVLERWQERLPEPVSLGIGVATGELIVGEMSGTRRTDFTVIGQAANLGVRLCSAAKGGEILLCEETYTLAQHHVIVAPMSGWQVRGLEREMMVYRVERLVSATGID
jgi:class 3 adenylate cyclase